jgi:ABC-2 type transport system ATP-binding protein
MAHAAIEATGLTKRYGALTVVDDVSFTVRPGAVTGFLGPNGAGKTTTLRMLLGLARPTAGTALVLGRRYAELTRPALRIGAVLEATDFHPGRNGRDHLRSLAYASGLPSQRADKVLELVDLSRAAGRRVKTYSLGMRQRLGLAAALLGDPELLILDEPANGLDPEGVRWLREFLRGFAGQGKTVFVSSHVLAEVAQTVDHVLIINHGRLVVESSLAELMARITGGVSVRSPQAERLAGLLAGPGVEIDRTGDAALVVRGASAPQIGEAAAAAGIVLHELAPASGSLEDVFLELTAGSEPQ